MSDQYAKQRTIKDITNNDERIQVTGYVKNRENDDSIVITDKTGDLRIKLIEPDNFNFDTDDLINIIGDLEFQSSGEKVLNAEIIQDMNKLNFEYYQKIYQIKKEMNLD
jgi:uncharacterized protein YdeI (BOF family)